jgi:hypothetical protein
MPWRMKRFSGELISEVDAALRGGELVQVRFCHGCIIAPSCPTPKVTFITGRAGHITFSTVRYLAFLFRM